MRIVLSLIILLLAACGSDPQPQAQPEADKDVTYDKKHNILDFKDGHKEMAAAMAKAKETFPWFVKNWKTMKNDGYSLKIAMKTSDDGIEHIWFNPKEISGDKITAECANEPRNIPDLKLGDVRELSSSQISDWMLVVGDKCYGGYTIQVSIKAQPKMAEQITYEFVEPQ